MKVFRLSSRNWWNEDDFFAVGKGMGPVGESAIDGDHHAFTFEGDGVFGSDFFKESGGGFGVGLDGFFGDTGEFFELGEVGDGNSFHGVDLVESGADLDSIRFGIGVGERPESEGWDGVAVEVFEDGARATLAIDTSDCDGGGTGWLPDCAKWLGESIGGTGEVGGIFIFAICIPGVDELLEVREFEHWEVAGEDEPWGVWVVLLGGGDGTERADGTKGIDNGGDRFFGCGCYVADGDKDLVADGSEEVEATLFLGKALAEDEFGFIPAHTGGFSADEEKCFHWLTD